MSEMLDLLVAQEARDRVHKMAGRIFEGAMIRAKASENPGDIAADSVRFALMFEVDFDDNLAHAAKDFE